MKKKILAIALAVVMVVSTGCTKKDDNANQFNDVSLTDIHTAVKDTYGENYLPDMTLGGEEMKQMFGLEEEWYDEAIAEVPMMSGNVDTFIAVDAKDDHVEDVQNALTAYQTTLKEDAMQYPLNQLKIQASQVKTYGNKVFFIMLGTLSFEEEEQEEDQVVASFEAQNQRAIDTIEGLVVKK